MTITKKDTIILAVLFNIVILAGVIATAHQLSSKPEAPPREKGSSQQQCATEEKDLSDRYMPQEEGALAFDEIDQLLEEYISEEIPETPPPQAQKTEVKKAVKNQTKSATAKEAVPTDEFYVVKAGDNPWKIAKRFHISFEKLLQLNNLDEVKARNLKVGSRLRIREAS